MAIDRNRSRSSTNVIVLWCIVWISSLVKFEPVNGYKPVVIIHGIFDRRDSLQSLSDRIQEMHPGTSVNLIHKLQGWKSIAPMWSQVKSFEKVLRPIMDDNSDGVHIIGFSQGGLVARALIESIPDHNIHTFISLSSPQGGQYGDDFLRIYYPKYVKETAYKFLYSAAGQLVSVGNYWRDPHHLHSFMKYSKFLAPIDNLAGNRAQSTPTQGGSGAMDYKTHFAKLHRLVLIGGPDDGVISPWQSSHFGTYDENEHVVDMKDRDIYLDDLFGLQTLDKMNNLTVLTESTEWNAIVYNVYNYNWIKIMLIGWW